MGLRQRLAAWIGGNDYQDAATGVEFSKDLVEALQARANGTLDWQVAIQVSTALRCAVIKAEGICSVPWKIYQKVGNDRVEARDHPLWDVLHSSPNDWQTSFDFRKTIGMHLALEGNAYIWLNRVRGVVVEMLPLEPSRVRVCRNNDWSLTYRVTFQDGTQQEFGSKDIWHIRNHSWDSYKGLSALNYARRAISLALDMESAQADTHKNFARPSGVLSIEYDMEPEQFKKTRKLIDEQVRTRLSRGFPMVVDKTMQWTQMALKAVDAQTVESRGFQVEDIGRAMGILPIMLGYTGDKSATYASAEQMFIHHFTHTTRVDHRNVEQSADKWLLTKKDRRDGYYTGFVDQELLRGDTKARGEFYRLLWMIGVITGNEIRGMEEMNSLPGLDRPWAPLNSAPIGEDGMPKVADMGPSGSTAEEAFATVFKNASPMARQMFLSKLADLHGRELDPE